MFEFQRELDERYRSLRDSRSGPVFFLEHGMRDDEISDVFEEVRRSLRVHPIHSGWWHANCLSLIVAATEVGYRYRGSGTDFWPVLEAELQIKISATDRQQIRDLFASAARTYRGVQPPRTLWAKAFRFIAWPITHALLPQDFHRPLARTLANLRVGISELDNDSLHWHIRKAASNSTARFSTLLDDATLVVPVIRRLLGDDSVELCPETMERIATDLAADPVARRAVAVAKRIQRSVAEPSAPDASSRQGSRTISGLLFIRCQNSTLTLEAAFPFMNVDLQGRLRRALRRRRYAVRLWGLSGLVHSEQLVSGLPFHLKLSTIPPEDAELLPGLDQVDIEEQLRDALHAFKLDMSSTLLFAIDSEDKLGRRIHGPSISGHRRYWLLSRSGEGPSGCALVGEIGPYECHLLDPAEEIARGVLSNLGFRLHFGISVDFSGKPPLEPGAKVPVYVVGDHRILAPRRASAKGLQIQFDQEQFLLRNDEVAIVSVEREEHTLRVSNESEERDYSFRGTQQTRFFTPEICSIEVRLGDSSLEALLRGALEFKIDSIAPLNGLELTVEIEASGKKVLATTLLGPLPCSISSEQEPFNTLLDEDTRRLIAQSHSLRLRLKVGNLCSRSIELERRLRSCWWEQSDDGKIALASEAGMLPFGWIRATSPGALPELEPEEDFEDAKLLAPTGLDVLAHGRAGMFTTLCIAPDKVQLEAPVVQKPSLTRSRHSGKNRLGLEGVLESYLRWSLAESQSLIAELRRRQIARVLDQWVTEICCGEEWVRREAVQGDLDPWEGLLRACDETGFGRDPYVELSRNDEIEVTRFAIHEIQRQFPDLWDRVGPTCDLDNEEYEALDLACDRAYEKLAKVYRRQGMEDKAALIAEGQTGAAQDQWDEILQRVKSDSDLQPLAELLLPSDTASGLMELKPSIMNLDELTEELVAWTHSARTALAGDVPPVSILKSILALWAEPETAVGLDWRSAIAPILVERSLARAARYLAVRSRLADQGKSRR